VAGAGRQWCGEWGGGGSGGGVGQGGVQCGAGVAGVCEAGAGAVVGSGWYSTHLPIIVFHADISSLSSSYSLIAVTDY